MNNKRIAVIFAGQPRTFRHCYKSHLEFFKFDGYEFDYFIHAWSDQWWSPKTHSEHTVTNALIENPDGLKDELIKIYNPKAICIEKQIDCEDLIGDVEALIRLQKATKSQMWHNKNKSYTHGAWGRNHGVGRWLDGIHAGQIYSWQQATNLKIDYEKENNIQYDAVIKFRLDNILDFHNEKKKQNIWDNICNHLRGGFIDRKKGMDKKFERLFFQWQHLQPTGHWTVGDMIFGGPTESFDKLMKDIYTFLIRQYCSVFGHPDGHWKHAGPPETILAKKLQHESIPTHDIGVSQIPYREYHIELKDQSYKNLSMARQQADEGRVKK